MIINVPAALLGGTNQPGTLAYRHPEYEKRWWWWEFGRISYKGGREYLRPIRLSIDFEQPFRDVRNKDGQLLPTADTIRLQTSNWKSMLYRHNREQEWEYVNRQRRAYYHNIVRTIVNSLVSHATRQGVVREGDDIDLAFWAGVDKARSQNIDNFMRYGLRMVAVQGILWACVDNDASDVTAQQPTAPKAPGMPYVYWVSPLDILDWEVDNDGQIVWLKQFVYTEITRTWNSKVSPAYQYRVWTRTDVTTYQTDVQGLNDQLISTRKHGSDRVPFVPLYSLRDEDYPFPDGTPLAGDLCKGANHVFNLCSLLSEIFYKQTFSWLAIPDKNVDVLQMGVNTAFGYDPQGTSAKPEYISPDAAQAQVLMQGIADTIEQMRQAVGVGRGRSEGSKQKSSADALQLEDEDKRSILGDIASEAEDFEIRLMQTVASFRTKGATEAPTVRYSRQFELRTLQDEINEALSFRLLKLSPEINLELVSELVRKKFAGMDAEKLDEMVDTLKAVDMSAGIGIGGPVGQPNDSNQPGNNAGPPNGAVPRPGQRAPQSPEGTG